MNLHNRKYQQPNVCHLSNMGSMTQCMVSSNKCMKLKWQFGYIVLYILRKQASFLNQRRSWWYSAGNYRSYGSRRMPDVSSSIPYLSSRKRPTEVNLMLSEYLGASIIFTISAYISKNTEPKHQKHNQPFAYPCMVTVVAFEMFVTFEISGTLNIIGRSAMRITNIVSKQKTWQVLIILIIPKY